jgi:hypothetical protein
MSSRAPMRRQQCDGDRAHVISLKPRPEERAPKSGLPDFGISLVSKIGNSRFRSARLEGQPHAYDHASRRHAGHGSSA